MIRMRRLFTSLAAIGVVAGPALCADLSSQTAPPSLIEPSPISTVAATQPKEVLIAEANSQSAAISGPGVATLALNVTQALGDPRALGESPDQIYLVAISDTAAQVAAHFEALGAVANLASITLVDGGTPTLTLTAGQAAKNIKQLAALTGGYQIAIVDSAARIPAVLDALNSNGHLASIAFTDAGTPTLTLTASQAVNDGKALAALTGSYAVVVSDAAANVAAQFDALNALANLPAIALTDAGAPTLTLTAGQAARDVKALAALTGEYEIAVVDAAANLPAVFDTLNANTHLASIALTDAGTPTLALTVAQTFDNTDALAAIETPYAIAVNDSAAQILQATSALSSIEQVAGLNIADTAANVSANIDALNANTNIKSIALTDGGTQSLTLSVAQAAGDTRALGAIVGAYRIAIADTAANILASFDALNAAPPASIKFTDAAAPVLTFGAAQAVNDAKALAALTGAYKIVIADTAANISTHFDALSALPHLDSVALTDGGTPTLALTAVKAAKGDAALAALTGAYFVAVADTAANVVAYFDAIDARTNIASISLTDQGTPNLTLTVAQALGKTRALSEIAGSYALVVADTAANVAAQFDALNTLAPLDSIALTDEGKPTLTLTAAQGAKDGAALAALKGSAAIAIADTAAQVAAHIGALNDLAPLASIALTDGEKPTLPLNVAQTLNQPRALAAIVSPYAIEVTDAAPAILGSLEALGRVAQVASINVADRAEVVSASFDALNAAPGIASITVTDGAQASVALDARQAANDTKALAKLAGTFAIAVTDTTANVAAQFDALNGASHLASIALTDGATVGLSLTATQAADNAKSIAALSGPGEIGVTDTAANVSSRFDALNANPRLRSIVLTDEGTPALGLNARQTIEGAAALRAISGPYSVAVRDDASAISANFGALNADGRISSIAVSDSNPLRLTVAQINGGAVALDKIASDSFKVVVVDTAANLAAVGKEPFSKSYVVSIGVSDTAENVAAQLDALNANSTVSEIILTGDQAPILGVTLAQALADKVALDKIKGPFALAVRDTTANVLANLDALNLDPRVRSIARTDGLDAPLKFTVQQALAYRPALEKLSASNTPIVVSDNALNVSAGLAALAADPFVSSITVVDAAANILANKIVFVGEPKITGIVVADKAANVAKLIDQLEITGKIGAIHLSDTGKAKLVLSVAQALADKKTLAAISGPYKIEIVDTVANVLADRSKIEANPAVASIDIVDTPSAIAGELPTLIRIPLYRGYSLQTSSAEPTSVGGKVATIAGNESPAETK